jgi:hypothetical protein
MLGAPGFYAFPPLAGALALRIAATRETKDGRGCDDVKEREVFA